jgi:ammonium transporter, Amt family
VFLLLFLMYSAGSILIITNDTNGRVSALAAVTSTMASACGAIACMLLDSICDSVHTGETSYDLTAAMNGALAGLVGITSGCATVHPWSACIIGAVAGAVYLGASKLLIKLRIDDAVDAIPVHLACGMWGVIAPGLFSNRLLMDNAGYSGSHEGWFLEWGNGSGNASVLATQLAGLAWILAWVGGIMTPFFLVLNALGQFRVDRVEEEVGLDISHHRGAAYDLSGAKKEHVEELLEIRASRHGKVEVPLEVAKAADVAQNEPKGPYLLDEDEA